MMMRYMFSCVAACCGLLLMVGSGCSKKPDPTPEETSLLRSDGTGSRVGFKGNAEDDLLDSGEISGEPFDIDLGERNIDLGDYDESTFRKNLFDPVYFGFDQYSIDPNERDKLTDVADFLKREPAVQLLIEGHCDWKGTPEYNLSLGDRRATSVMQYLIDLSVDPGRMSIVSKGDANAKIEGTGQDMSMDRKAQFVVIPGS